MIAKVFSNETFSGDFVHAVFIPQYVLLNRMLGLLRNENNRLSPVTLAQVQGQLLYLSTLLSGELQHTEMISNSTLGRLNYHNVKRQDFLKYLMGKLATNVPFFVEPVIPNGPPI